MNAGYGLKSIKMGRRVGYRESCRIWDRNIKRTTNHHPGFEPGEYISPAGTVWRPCGLYGPGLLLVNWKKKIGHSVDWRTLMKLQAMGWVWRPDNAGPMPKFTVYRWPDGTHYYVLPKDGDPLPGKWDTYAQAFRHGTHWAAQKIVEKSV